MTNFITLPDGNIINTDKIVWIKDRRGFNEKIIYLQGDSREGGLPVNNDFFEKEIRPGLESYNDRDERMCELNIRISRLTEALDRLSAHIPSSLRIHY